MSNSPLLEQVHNGMRVFDSVGDNIGKVDLVRFADSSEDPSYSSTVTGKYVGAIAEVMSDDGTKIPQALKDRYRRSGYFRVDGKGWIDTDRVVTSDQISSVSGDDVHLNVPKEQLLET